MNFILTIPLWIRLFLLLVGGAWLGSQLNRAIYCWAVYMPRNISPWSALPSPDSRRTWFDRIPVIGWFALRRESELFGRGFWVRPLLIELACAIGLPWYYVWHTDASHPGLIPFPVSEDQQPMLHLLFLLHSCLLALMIIATFIDFDEKTIPDKVTVTGTLIALVAACLFPMSHLPVVNGVLVEPLHFYSPDPVAEGHRWHQSQTGLAAGLACLIGWCLALLLPYGITWRYGIARGIQLAIASVLRPPRKTQPKLSIRPRRIAWTTVALLVSATLGSAVVVGMWLKGGALWTSLLTSLIGMAFGGGIVWAVRIGGKLALGQEAMGFGDVTLMAMIGAFLGWQPALLVFLLAPISALVIAVAQFVLTQKHEIAFGPYLCFSAAFVMIKWETLWNQWAALTIFAHSSMLLAVLGVGLVLMTVVLFAWRWFKEKILGIEPE